MRNGRARLSRVGVLAPAALSVCIDASVLAAPAAGAALSTVLKELSKSFMLKKWFHGVMTAQEAEQLLLEQGRQGSYLVRESHKHPGKYALSVRLRTRVAHVLIHRKNNRYDLGNGEVFGDLTALIEHCRAYPLRKASGEVLRLRQPVSGARTMASTSQRVASDTDSSEGESVAGALLKPKQKLYRKMDRHLKDVVSEQIPNGNLNQSEYKTEDTDSDELNIPSQSWLRFRALSRTYSHIGFTQIEGNRDVNKYKNRYSDVIPYDHTRVPLPRSCISLDECYTDYINASYIRPDWMYDLLLPEPENPALLTTHFHSSDWQNLDAYDFRNRHNKEHPVPWETDSCKFYIATQGCLAVTRHAFWAMIADNDVRVIVMAMDGVENGTRCDKYWPLINEMEEMGDIEVKTNAEYDQPYYTMREMEMKAPDKNPRTIFQYQLKGWVEYVLPYDTHAVIRQINDVDERMRMVAQGPDPPRHNILCVHCSAGIGRTGMFIALDQLIDNTKLQEEHYDIEAEVTDVLTSMMIQRPDIIMDNYQMNFITDTLDDYLNTEPTSHSSIYASF